MNQNAAFKYSDHPNAGLAVHSKGQNVSGFWKVSEIRIHHGLSLGYFVHFWCGFSTNIQKLDFFLSGFRMFLVFGWLLYFLTQIVYLFHRILTFCELWRYMNGQLN